MSDIAVTTGRVLVASFAGPRGSDLGTMAAGRVAAVDEASETQTDEAPSETHETSAEGPDEADDFANDHERAGDRTEDQDAHLAEQAEKQRRHEYLHALETGYRDRFLLLNRLLDRLAAAHEFLTQRRDERFNTF